MAVELPVNTVYPPCSFDDAPLDIPEGNPKNSHHQSHDLVKQSQGYSKAVYEAVRKFPKRPLACIKAG